LLYNPQGGAAAFPEIEIGLLLVIAGVIGYFYIAGVVVVCKPVMPVIERHAAAHDMVHRYTEAAQLEAVLVAVTGGAAIGQVAILIRNTVFQRYPPYRAGFRLGIKIPAVINIVMGNASPENIAPGQQQALSPAPVMVRPLIYQ